MNWMEWYDEVKWLLFIIWCPILVAYAAYFGDMWRRSVLNVSWQKYYKCDMPKIHEYKPPYHV